MMTRRAKRNFRSILPMTAATAVATAITLSAGCLGPRRADYQTEHAIATPADSLPADALWEAAKETLRRHRFRLDRLDRHAGVITTIPETSQAIFEFWRNDVNTTPDLWESTLNPIRRRVEIRFQPDAEGNWARLAVVVQKQRLSAPDRQFNSTGAAYQFFGDTLPTTEGKMLDGETQTRWIDIGHDPAMEECILREILDLAGLPARPCDAKPATRKNNNETGPNEPTAAHGGRTNETANRSNPDGPAPAGPV